LARVCKVSGFFMTHLLQLVIDLEGMAGTTQLAFWYA
jgi:hypothetical protein